MRMYRRTGAGGASCPEGKTLLGKRAGSGCSWAWRAAGVAGGIGGRGLLRAAWRKAAWRALAARAARVERVERAERAERSETTDLLLLVERVVEAIEGERHRRWRQPGTPGDGARGGRDGAWLRRSQARLRRTAGAGRACHGVPSTATEAMVREVVVKASQDAELMQTTEC